MTRPVFLPLTTYREVSVVALENRHIADRIELGDFSALPAEYYYATALFGRE
jgi:hypothetical protein